MSVEKNKTPAMFGDFLSRPHQDDLTGFGEALERAWLYVGFDFDRAAHWLGVSENDLALIETGRLPAPKGFIKKAQYLFKMNDKMALDLEVQYANLSSSIDRLFNAWAAAR